MGSSFVTSLLPLTTLYILLVVLWLAIGLYIYLAIPNANGVKPSIKDLWKDFTTPIKDTFGKMGAFIVSIFKPKEKEPKPFIELPPVEIEGLLEKEHYVAGQEVAPGLYVEVTPLLESVNHFERLTEVGVLPKQINPKNSYILVSDQDRDRLVLKNMRLGGFNSYTPGTTVDPGYYVEINTKQISTGYYIYTETKVPPSAAKGYRWVRFIRRKLIHKALQETQSKRIDLGAVVIPGITSRPTYKSEDLVDEGLYLEITPRYESVNHFEFVTAGNALPALINPNNMYVRVTEEEKQKLTLTNIDLSLYDGMTPGTTVDKGYYVEINLEKRSTGYYIYTETKLPPSAAKGYRWVRFMRRQLLDK